MSEDADGEQHGHSPEHETQHTRAGSDRIGGGRGGAERRIEQPAGQESEHKAEDTKAGHEKKKTKDTMEDVYRDDALK